MNDAHAAESGGVASLKDIAAEATDADVRTAITEHIAVSQSQADRLKARILALGGDKAEGKSLINTIIGKGSDLLIDYHDKTDKQTQDIIKAYALEHFEIGMYTSLKSFAGRHRRSRDRAARGHHHGRGTARRRAPSALDPSGRQGGHPGKHRDRREHLSAFCRQTRSSSADPPRCCVCLLGKLEGDHPGRNRDFDTATSLTLRRFRRGRADGRHRRRANHHERRAVAADRAAALLRAAAR